MRYLTPSFVSEEPGQEQSGGPYLLEEYLVEPCRIDYLRFLLTGRVKRWPMTW